MKKQGKTRWRMGPNGSSLPGAYSIKDSGTTARKKIGKSKGKGRPATRIREGEQTLFNEEFGKRDVEDPLDAAIFDTNPTEVLTSPLQKSVDMCPMSNSSNHETSIEMEDPSILYESTEPSTRTTPRNVCGDREVEEIQTISEITTSQIENEHSEENLMVDAISSTDTCFEVKPERRRKSRLRKFSVRRPKQMTRLTIDVQGRIIDNEEMKLIWLASGKCTKCGIHKTHIKEKFGPFGVFRRMSPQTLEGISYKGYCLHCNDVPKLRILLNDPDIPLDLPRHSPLVSNIQSQRSLEAGVIELPQQKRSAVMILCTSIRFQMVCLVLILGIVGTIIGIAIKFSKEPEVWISPAPSPAPSNTPSTLTPTGSPTSYEWNFSSEIVSDEAFFGYKVKLSADGNILVVHAQNFENGKGRFDVYAYEELLDEKKWLKLDWELGMVISKSSSYDTQNNGIHLSDDGSTVAFGLPGDGNGVVEIYNIDVKKMKVSSKGSPIMGPISQSEFGYSVALNFDGTRLFVGAPNYGISESNIVGLVRAYDYQASTNSWIQVGSDMVGEISGTRFGNSVGSSNDGTKIVIGAPHDSTVYEHGGKVYFFTFDQSTQIWYHYPRNYLYGSKDNSELGAVVEVNANGHFAVTSMKKSHDELFKNAGVVLVCFYQEERQMIEILGFPISGVHVNVGLGYDVDINSDAGIVVASEQNDGSSSGSVQVYASSFGYFVVEGKAIPGVPLGSCGSVGKGTSVSLATSEGLRLAIGYECALIEGQTKSLVHIYEIYGTDEQVRYPRT